MPEFKRPSSGTPLSIGESFGVEQHDIFYAAIQRSRMPMVLTDPSLPDNPVVFHNDSFSALTGYAGEEIIGRNCRFLQGPETDPSVVAHIRECIAQETDCTVELLNYRKDGSRFWNGLFISPVYNNDGKLVYFFASQLDITRRVQSEDLLRQTQKLETLGQLTGGIAHDFNNMLTVVMGNLKMAQTRIERGEDVSVCIERAISAARSSDRLTQQLLSFARKQRMEHEKTNLNNIIVHVQEMIERIVPPDVVITTDLASNPQCVMLDRSHAESAILNILINARDALPTKGGTIKIRTRNIVADGTQPAALKLDESYVQLDIEDTGSGMTEAVRKRIFEPFFTTKKVGQGSGMGMAMVHGFVEQSGAKICTKSKVGHGTTVTIFFPALDSVWEDAPLNSVRLLVVEDNHIVRETTVDFMRINGFTVRHAEHAAAALAVLEDGYVPDVIFSDIIMPGQLDGLALAKLVRTKYPLVKIILTSGWSDQDSAEKEFRIVAKPYDLDSLVTMFNELAQSKKNTAHSG